MLDVVAEKKYNNNVNNTVKGIIICTDRSDQSMQIQIIRVNGEGTLQFIPHGSSGTGCSKHR